MQLVQINKKSQDRREKASTDRLPRPETSARPRLPPWLKVRAAQTPGYHHLKSETNRLGLTTVCQQARCPNIGECWQDKTLTIMIMGDTCTRFCRFCNVKTGHPHGILDANEPQKTAELLHPLDLRYVVITSVDRDDLVDGGASHFAATIRAVKKRCPETTLEVLIGDFAGDTEALKRVVDAGPDVLSHNVETVPRLQGKVRDRRAHYQQSLAVLKHAKDYRPQMFTKSSLMLGLGESTTEVQQVMDDLRAIEVDFLTLGQYLRPNPKLLAVEAFIHPDQFADYREQGLAKGFKYVASGPLVRSSYKAGEFFINEYLKKAKAASTS